MSVSYAKAAEYWETIEPTIEGMLGGFGKLDLIDALSSSNFIAGNMTDGSMKGLRACDCGAGIGRVSKSFLLKHFKAVDLVEQTEKFLIQAAINFEDAGQRDRVSMIHAGLQDFTPTQNYDLVWCQWVLSHLTNEDLIAFLIRCKHANPSFIGIKENVSETDLIYDIEDSSMTRTDVIWKDCFEKAGLKLVKESIQKSFPSELFVVKMYLLK